MDLSAFLNDDMPVEENRLLDVEKPNLVSPDSLAPCDEVIVCPHPIETVQKIAEHIIIKYVSLTEHYAALPVDAGYNPLLVVLCPTLFKRLLEGEYNQKTKMLFFILVDYIDWSNEIHLVKGENCYACFLQKIEGNVLKQTKLEG
jgi:hypothetical protein